MKLPEVNTVKWVSAFALVKAAGFNDDQQSELFHRLSDEDYTWGTNGYSLISANSFMDFMSEYENDGTRTTPDEKLSNLSILLGELDSNDIYVDLES